MIEERQIVFESHSSLCRDLDYFYPRSHGLNILTRDAPIEFDSFG